MKGASLPNIIPARGFLSAFKKPTKTLEPRSKPLKWDANSCMSKNKNELTIENIHRKYLRHFFYIFNRQFSKMIDACATVIPLIAVNVQVIYRHICTCTQFYNNWSETMEFLYLLNAKIPIILLLKPKKKKKRRKEAEHEGNNKNASHIFRCYSIQSSRN